jgi:hypothetical protein
LTGIGLRAASPVPVLDWFTRRHPVDAMARGVVADRLSFGAAHAGDRAHRERGPGERDTDHGCARIASLARFF